MDRERSIELLQAQVDAANGGKPADLAGWRLRTATAARVALGASHPANKQLDEVTYGLMVWSPNTPDSAFADAQEAGVRSATKILEAAIYELEISDGLTSDSANLEVSEPAGTSVFLVHGHDARRSEVAHAIERLTGEQAVVLHEQPDGGRTIIEKFEDHAASARFAVALLTADDVGRGVSDADLRQRARQNVVFEAGFFVGRLGRGRVVLLYEPGVELPSDLDGVLYTELDRSGAWRYALGKEMRHAGMTADLNNL